MPLEMRHYELLAAVAEAGSLTAATRRLHLTASALSHQLRDAEERLGVVLFQRRHRSLLPTAAGERLVEAARRVLAEARRAEAGARGEPQDLIRVSTGCYTAYSWLPPVLERFQPLHPHVEIRLVLEATRQPIAALLRGELDLALTSDPANQGRLRSFPLFADELVLVVPSAHPLAVRGVARPEDLRHEHLIVYDAPREDLDVFTRLLWPAAVEPRKVSRVPLTEAMLDLVRAGTGLAVVVGWAVPPDPGLTRVRLSAPGLKRRWRAVALRQRSTWKPLRDLIEQLRLVSARAPAPPRALPNVASGK